jgi:peptide/nickel transport system substrate-binding protein
MREYETYVLDTQAHMLRDAVVGADRTHARVCKGRKISPSHYVNLDLATVWLDK